MLCTCTTLSNSVPHLQLAHCWNICEMKVFECFLCCSNFSVFWLYKVNSITGKLKTGSKGNNFPFTTIYCYNSVVSRLIGSTPSSAIVTDMSFSHPWNKSSGQLSAVGGSVRDYCLRKGFQGSLLQCLALYFTLILINSSQLLSGLCTKAQIVNLNNNLILIRYLLLFIYFS